MATKFLIISAHTPHTSFLDISGPWGSLGTSSSPSVSLWSDLGLGAARTSFISLAAPVQVAVRHVDVVCCLGIIISNTGANSKKVRLAHVHRRSHHRGHRRPTFRTPDVMDGIASSLIICDRFISANLCGSLTLLISSGDWTVCIISDYFFNLGCKSDHIRSCGLADHIPDHPSTHCVIIAGQVTKRRCFC